MEQVIGVIRVIKDQITTLRPYNARYMGDHRSIFRKRYRKMITRVSLDRSGNPIASSAVCAGPEWDDLRAVTRVACQWPARVTNARFWPVTDGSFCGWDRTRAAHREDVFTAEAGRQNDLPCCPVAWPAGRASRCNSVMLAGLYRSGAGVRLSCLG